MTREIKKTKKPNHTKPLKKKSAHSFKINKKPHRNPVKRIEFTGIIRTIRVTKFSYAYILKYWSFYTAILRLKMKKITYTRNGVKGNGQKSKIAYKAKSKLSRSLLYTSVSKMPSLTISWRLGLRQLSIRSRIVTFETYFVKCFLTIIKPREKTKNIINAYFK